MLILHDSVDIIIVFWILIIKLLIKHDVWITLHFFLIILLLLLLLRVVANIQLLLDLLLLLGLHFVLVHLANHLEGLGKIFLIK